ncbi:hypothetical protein HK102_011124 [Quaeritorhiza haematococci]|nr:hypothetical protein HK102_011124 [Quaeritorhiza haematococci]
MPPPPSSSPFLRHRDKKNGFSPPSTYTTYSTDESSTSVPPFPVKPKKKQALKRKNGTSNGTTKSKSKSKSRDGNGGSWLWRWGVLYPAYVVGFYAIILSLIVAFPHTFQPYLIYVHWVRWPFWVQWDRAEVFGFREGTVRAFKFTTSDNITLGGWHVLPRSEILPVSTYHTYLTNNNYTNDETLKGTSVTDDQYDAMLRKAKRVILYCHGNAGNRASFHRVQFYKQITALGTGDTHLITIDYRGFGDSDRITPSEKGLQLDALAAYNWILSRGVESGKVIVVGHSLGSGVATWLAGYLSRVPGEGVAPPSNGADSVPSSASSTPLSSSIANSPNESTGGAPLEPPGALVLVAAYTSIPDAAIHYPNVPVLYPFRSFPSIANFLKRFVVEKWESVERIGAVGWVAADGSGMERDVVVEGDGGSRGRGRCPIFIVHGSVDREMPVEFGRKLFVAGVEGRLRRHQHQQTQQREDGEGRASAHGFVNAPQDPHPVQPKQFGEYEIVPVGDEGWLWKSVIGDGSSEATSTLSSSGNTESDAESEAEQGYVGGADDVWFLEVAHGGHNNLHDFEVVNDALWEFLSAHGL